MGKKHKNKNKEEVEKEKFSSILTTEQKQKFKLFGRPDMSQNWLELFDSDLLHDLHTIMECCSDNQQKADYVIEELKAYGFVAVGLGTNIVVLSNPNYPGVVFKIALDEFGIADNFNDCVLQDVVPKYNRVLARDPSAMISVQERQVLLTPAQRELFMPNILRLLKELSKYFLVADLSPSMWLNYGVTRGGDFCFIDGSDLYPLHQLKGDLSCKKIIGEHKKTGKLKHCEGNLVYSDDFQWLICKKCGARYNPLELRPRKEVGKMQRIMSDGLSAEERNKLEQTELDAILREKELREEPKADPIWVSATKLMGFEDTEETKQIPVEILTADTQEARKSAIHMHVAEELNSSAGSTHVLAEGELEDSRESSDSDDSDEDEAVQNEDDESDDGILVLTGSEPLRRKEPKEEAQTKHVEYIDQDDEDADMVSESAEEPDEYNDDEEDDNVQNIADQVINVLLRFKSSDDPELRRLFSKILNSVMGVHTSSMDNGDSLARVMLPTLAEKLSRSSDPKDLKVLQQVVHDYNFNEAEDDLEEVENDLDNKEIHDSGEENSEPHVTYQVINELDSNDDSVMPGVFLNIVGDFDEAYDTSGLPVYVSVDNGATWTNAIPAFKLKPLMDPVVEEAIILRDLEDNSRVRSKEPERDDEIKIPSKRNIDRELDMSIDII